MQNTSLSRYMSGFCFYQYKYRTELAKKPDMNCSSRDRLSFYAEIQNIVWTLLLGACQVILKLSYNYIQDLRLFHSDYLQASKSRETFPLKRKVNSSGYFRISLWKSFAGIEKLAALSI